MPIRISGNRDLANLPGMLSLLTAPLAPSCCWTEYLHCLECADFPKLILGALGPASCTFDPSLGEYSLSPQCCDNLIHPDQARQAIGEILSLVLGDDQGGDPRG